MVDGDDVEIEVLPPCKPKAVAGTAPVSSPSRNNLAASLPSSSKSSRGIPTRSSSRLKNQASNNQRLSSLPLPSTSSPSPRQGLSSREPGPSRVTRSTRNKPQTLSVSPSVPKSAVGPRTRKAPPIASDTEIIPGSMTESPISTSCRDSAESQVTSSASNQQLPHHSLSPTRSSRRAPPHTSQEGPTSITNEEQPSEDSPQSPIPSRGFKQASDDSPQSPIPSRGFKQAVEQASHDSPQSPIPSRGFKQAEKQASDDSPQSPVPSRGFRHTQSREKSPVPAQDDNDAHASSSTKHLLPTKPSNKTNSQSEQLHQIGEGIERQTDHKLPDPKRAKYDSNPSSSQQAVETGKVNLDAVPAPINQAQGTPQPPRSELNSQPTQTKPTRRPPRPIKRAPPSQNTKPFGTALEDEDAYFDLTARKPVQFVSKTLGLTRDSPGPSSVVVKSPVRNPQAPSQPANLIDLSSDEAESQAEDDEDDDSEFSEGEYSSPRKPRKSNNSPRKLPDWTKGKSSNIVTIASNSNCEKNPRRESILSSSSESESDKEAGKKPQTDGKQPVPRPKSRSPTPPPPMDPYFIARDAKALQQNQAARDEAAAYRNQLLAASQQAEEMRLMSALRQDAQDPAFATIRRQLANSSSQGNLGSHYPSGDPHFTGPHASTITLGVRIMLDPRMASRYSREQLDAIERTVFIEMGSEERFQSLYMSVETLTSLPSTKLVLVHGTIKISPFVTPASLKIGSKTILKAYELAAWNYLSTMSRQQPILLNNEPEPVVQTAHLPSAPSAPEEPAAEASVAAEEAEGSAATITITVRSGKTDDLELVVKPTTTFASIAKQFLKETATGPIQKTELSKMAKKCRVQFDGENLDLSSTVAETDIDKGDVLDLIVGN